ncbi:unnamed protein product [Mesocestoides corti]|uniref:RIIa domain-containing protein n=1 Tax=Mesocestoides corti TaxID=53468 RepID=A0A0R3UEU8_MESCO|nr:unnamed protein product [Mesocestoides corti]
MPIIEEPYYCHEQIEIPPILPDILKQFTKAAIRTQPKDPLAWSYEYFKALAHNEIPPVKERLEMAYCSQKTDTGLTEGILKTLHNQLGMCHRIPLCKIEEKWLALGLPLLRLQAIWTTGKFGYDAPWTHFLALAAAQISPTVSDTLALLCSLFTTDPEGSDPAIPFGLFTSLYYFLAAEIGSVPKSHVRHVIQHHAYNM